MIFFSYTRIVARISLIPVIVVAAICYIAAKNSSAIVEGLMNALIALAIWFGASFGIVGGIITAIVILRRRHGLKVINRTTRAVPTERDIPVISYTLYPEAKHAIDGRDSQETLINGVPISKLQSNSRYGKR
jgi:hypothetical protein